MQMRMDEAKHAQHAHTLGAKSLPWPIKTSMRATAKIMTKISYFY
jgi:ubiquinone biosynthesis monooxygenase Coq7